MSKELIGERYRDQVILPNGFQVLSAEAKTTEDLDRQLGDKLSEHTYEEGGEIPRGSSVKRERILKVGPFVLKRSPLSTRTLVP